MSREEEKMEQHKALLEIRLDRLEEDCAEQPKLMRTWSYYLAFAKKRSKEAKNDVKLKFAELSLRIRANPVEFGFEKVTEGTVEAIILCNDEYREAQQEQIEAEYEQDVLEGMVESIKDRRYQLGNETQLYNGQYFSKPDVIGKQPRPNREPMPGKTRKKK